MWETFQDPVLNFFLATFCKSFHPLPKIFLDLKVTKTFKDDSSANGLRKNIYKSGGLSYEILEKQDFVTGSLKFLQKILIHVPRFSERKILFAPLVITFLNVTLDKALYRLNIDIWSSKGLQFCFVKHCRLTNFSNKTFKAFLKDIFMTNPVPSTKIF
jgi:hypothetical protein